MGATLGPDTSNSIGVPQGSVLSPTLFNLAMAGLPHALVTVNGLGFAIYAYDVTLWMKRAAPSLSKKTYSPAMTFCLYNSVG